MYYKYLDKNYALKYLDNDLNLLSNILADFLNQYKNVNLCTLQNDFFFKEVHQLKSFSKNIGSKELFLISEEINRTQNRTYEEKLQRLLNKLLEEIEFFLKQERNLPIKNNQKKATNDEDIKNLFDDILLYAKKNRPKRIEDTAEKLKNFTLKEKEHILLTNINEEIKMYSFKNIVSLIEKWKNND